MSRPWPKRGEISQRDAIVKAAETLPLKFTETEVIVAAWRLAPDALGMDGFPYPDTHRGRSVICGKRGLVGTGRLVRHSDGKLSLPLTPARMLMLTTAYRLFESGQKLEITRFDAQDFWQTHKHRSNQAAIEKTAALLMARDNNDERLVGACHDYMVGRYYDLLCGTVNGKPVHNSGRKIKPGKASHLPAMKVRAG